MTLAEIFDRMGRALSRNRIKWVDSKLHASGIKIKPEIFSGFLFFLCALLAIALSSLFVGTPAVRLSAEKLLTYASLPHGPAAVLFAITSLSFLLSIILMSLFAYTYLSLRADARRRFVDNVLPDFLMLACANIRAGMSTDQALWQAAKPEFGILSIEVEGAAKAAFAGEPFDRALERICNAFDSRLLRRAISLIKQSVATGGQTAEVLDATAQDARNMQIISKEISSSLLMYLIFVVFASVVGAPFLLAVSQNLIETLEGVFAKMPAAPSGGGGFALANISAFPITPNEFFLFSLAVLVCTMIFASLLIGIIQRGSKAQGIKYMPFLILAGLAIYFAVRAALGGFLSGGVL